MRCRQLVFLIVSLASGGSAFGSSFYPREFPATIATTPVVLHGKVVGTKSDFLKTADGGQQLYTFSELEVIEVLKGKVETKRVTIRELGGTKNGVTMEIPGTSQFSAGEDVVVLLAEPAHEGSVDSFPIMNMSFGKLTVERTADGHDVLHGPALTGSPPSGEKAWTIHEVKEVIEHPPAPNFGPKILMDARTNTSPRPSISPGKTGLLSDSGHVPVPSSGEATPIPSAAATDTESHGLRKRTIVLAGIAFGILFFLRSYLKKR